MPEIWFSQICYLASAGTSPARVGRWGQALCCRRARGRPTSCCGKFGEPLRGVRGTLRVFLEGGMFSTNKYCFMWRHKFVFKTNVTPRVPNTSPARIGRPGRALCYRVATGCPTPGCGKFGEPLRGGPGGSESPPNGARVLRTNILQCHTRRMLLTNL